MRRFTGTALTALVVAAAGCGGGDDDKALTKAEYIKQADAICKSGNAKLNEAAGKLGASPTKEQIIEVGKSVFIPNLEAQLKDLRGLTPPKADTATIEKLETDLDAAISKLKADPSLLAATDAGPFTEVNAEATAYGLTECGAG